jgi:corrinoid protein of di/trimethylamine methyltransferase
MEKEEILSTLENAVVTGKRDIAIGAARSALDEGLDPLIVINEGLVKGMTIVGDKYAAHEMFLPQVLLAANTMYGGLDVLLPAIPKAALDDQINVVIGVVEGDVHDIGKNIVKTMMTAGGFSVNDLGRDVPIETFVDTVESDSAKIVAMSTLMTPTMDGMKSVVDGLVESGRRGGLKVIIGGAPTSQEFADTIGADYHAINAQQAVKVLKGAF